MSVSNWTGVKAMMLNRRGEAKNKLSTVRLKRAVCHGQQFSPLELKPCFLEVGNRYLSRLPLPACFSAVRLSGALLSGFIYQVYLVPIYLVPLQFR